MDYSGIDTESVAWAFDQASDLLRTERARIDSLNDRAAQLAGFAGIALAIMTGLAPRGLELSLGAVGNVVFLASYVIAALLLAATILWVVALVYVPRSDVGLSPDTVGEYATDPRLLSAEPWALQIRALTTIHLAAQWAAATSTRMARRMVVGASLFGVGLGSSILATVTIGIGAS